MKTQNTNTNVLNAIVNVSAYIFLAGATSSLIYTVYTFVSLLF